MLTDLGPNNIFGLHVCGEMKKIGKFSDEVYEAMRILNFVFALDEKFVQFAKLSQMTVRNFLIRQLFSILVIFI